MIHLFKSFTAKLWAALLALIILIGVMISMGRLFTPMVGQLRDNIAALASDMLGQPVLISEFTGDWRGLGPELILRNVSLVNTQTHEVTLNLPEIRISFALLDSLRHWTLKPRQIRLVRPRLLITRHLDGSFTTAGINRRQSAETTGNSALLLFPGRVTVEHGDIFWKNERFSGSPLHLRDVQVSFLNNETRHQLTGALTLPGKDQGRLQVAADITGRLDSPSGWSGELYVKGATLDLGETLRYRLPLNYHIDSGVADVTFWSHWKAGQLQRVSGETRWDNLQVSLNNDGQETKDNLEGLTGEFSWEKTRNGWHLDLDGYSLTRSTSAWPASSASLEMTRQGEQPPLLLANLGYLRIEDLLPILPLLPHTWEAILDSLSVLQPRGELRQTQLRLSLAKPNMDWQLETDFSGLHYLPWKDIPGIQGLSGHLDIRPQGGNLTLDSQQSVIDFNGLFRAPLQMQKIQGELQLSREEKGNWTLTGDNLVASNADLYTRTRLQLTIPTDAEQPTVIDLQSDFENGDGSRASRYYPTAIMDNALVDWLDKSIVDGRVIRGSCLLRGPLRDFPFETSQTGAFEVAFRLENATLDYQPGWPAIKGLNADIRFHNDSLDIHADGGVIYNSRIDHLDAGIERLSQATPVVIDGQITGPFSDTFRLLREAPIKEKLSRFTSDLEATGTTRLGLKMAVPLGTEAWKLRGALDFKGATLTLSDWQLPFEEIQGRLNFDLKQINADGIRASLMDNPVTINVITPEGEDKTRINAIGQIALDTLIKQNPALDNIPLHGGSQWSSQLDIPHLIDHKHRVVLQLKSDLRGTEVTLPIPLKKPADTASFLKLRTEITGTSKQPIWLDYADRLRAAVWIDKTQSGWQSLVGGQITLGNQKPDILSTPGVSLEGVWPEIDAGQWLTALSQGSSGSQTPPLQDIQIRLRHMILGDSRLNNVKISMQRVDNGWEGVTSSDRHIGRVFVPDNLANGRIKAHLEQARLKFDPDTLSQTRTNDSLLKPEDVPTIDLTVDTLYLNNHNFEKFRLITSRSRRGLELDALKVDTRLLKLNLSGEWRKDPNNIDNTVLNIDLDSKNFGDLLTTFGFARNLEQAPAAIHGQISWPASPMAFSRDHFNGHLNLALDKGRFLDVDPGVGRIFGLLNLGALQRRLSLDFSDMLKQGLTFDKITGSFQIDGGDAYTSDLKLVGPATKIEISGRTGLAREDFDQEVTVTPSITSSLPMAGAIAGGPAVGAALLVAQKILGKRLDKITQRKYLVTGSWSDPNIEQLKPRNSANGTTSENMGDFNADTGGNNNAGSDGGGD